MTKCACNTVYCNSMSVYHSLPITNTMICNIVFLSWIVTCRFSKKPTYWYIYTRTCIQGFSPTPARVYLPLATLPCGCYWESSVPFCPLHNTILTLSVSTMITNLHWDSLEAWPTNSRLESIMLQNLVIMLFSIFLPIIATHFMLSRYALPYSKNLWLVTYVQLL